MYYTILLTFYVGSLFVPVVDYVLPERGQSLLEAYNQWRNEADAKACCDYGLHVCITWWSDRVAEEVEILAKERGSYDCHDLIQSYWLFSEYIKLVICSLI